MSAQAHIFSKEYKTQHWKNSYFGVEFVFYLLQGLFLAGMTTYGTVRLAEWAIPLAQQATFAAITGFPAYVKLFIGLLTDRVIVGKWGRRKPYIILGLIITIPSYIFYITTDSYTGLLIAQTLAFVSWAFVDTTLDALTVDITPDEYDSRMQSYAQTGRYTGMAIGAFAVPFLGPIIGWKTIIMIIGLFGILMPISALQIQEGRITKEDLSGKMALGPMFKKAFTSKTTWLGILISIFMFGGITFSMVGNYVLTNFKWAADPAKLQAYGIASSLGLVGTITGSMLMGRIYKTAGFKMKTIVIVTIAFIVLTASWFLFELNPDNVWLYSLCTFLRNIGNGMMIVTLYTVVMRVSTASIEGFMFAIMTSVMNVGQIIISPKTLGYTLPKVGITASLLILSVSVVVAVSLIGVLLKELETSRDAETQPSFDAATL
jgi:predicted MFS family arabinose efflux permease